MNAIIREVEEEIGLTIKDKPINFIDKIILENKPCIFNIFYLEMDLDIKSVNLQEEEVEQLFWLDRNEIEKLIESNQFLKSHGILFKYIL